VATWSVIVRSAPPLGFYRASEGGASNPFTEGEHTQMLRWPRLLSVSSIRRAIRFGKGENATARVTLDNADGALTGYMADIPLLRQASILRDGVEVFLGRVRRVRLSGGSAELEVES
jgi:hypothetical protein